MKLLQAVMLCLSYATFLGADATRLDPTPDMRKKWMEKVLFRVKRDIKPSEQGAADARASSAFIRTEDVKDTMPAGSSSEPHLRVKRYRQSLNHYPHLQSLRVGCRFGTCTVQNLAHQIFQYTDKDKDGTAPASKISSMGYGRRRRRSAPARLPGPWAQLIRSLRGRRQASASRLHKRVRREKPLPWGAIISS